MSVLKSGMALVAIAALAFSASAAQERADDPSAKEPIITIGKNSLWREPEMVVSHYEMICPSGESVALKLEATANSLDILELTVSGTAVTQSLVEEIEEAIINDLGGLDYPYAACARDKVGIWFAYHPPNGDIKIVGRTLN